MRITGNDTKELLNLYINLNESSATNMGSGTPAAVTVPAPGDAASGGSGKLKGPAPGHQSTIGGPGSEANEEEACGDEQISMAKNQLLIAADRALELYQILDNGTGLEAWVASKITLGSDYIETVADYMKYSDKSSETDRQVSVIPIEIESETMVGEAVKQRLDKKFWPGKRKQGTKIKGGIRVNNCVPIKKSKRSS